MHRSNGEVARSAGVPQQGGVAPPVEKDTKISTIAIT